MKSNSNLAEKISTAEFILTAEWAPPATGQTSAVEAATAALGNHLAAVSVADNHAGVAMSSVAASAALLKLGWEPICQIVTRDRNRIALQSDLLGAAALGIRNVLCTSGRHQALMGRADSANVYDLDAIQLVGAVRQMRDEGMLLDGAPVSGQFPMLIGAVINPCLRPLELGLIQLAKKIEAGADFLQTHPVFDVAEFEAWLSEARQRGLAEKTAIIAGVLPLTGAEEAEQLRDIHTDLHIPDAVVERLKSAGDADAQKAQGVKLCAEAIARLKDMEGVRGIHILSGGREKVVPELRREAGL
jgi:methylenetetrahydrofolate reductase (NADPH)